MIQIPDDLLKQVVALLMEMPAKHSYVTIKRIQTECVEAPPPATPSTEAPPNGN